MVAPFGFKFTKLALTIFKLLEFCKETYLCGSGEMSFLFNLNIGILASMMLSGDLFLMDTKLMVLLVVYLDTNLIWPLVDFCVELLLWDTSHSSVTGDRLVLFTSFIKFLGITTFVGAFCSNPDADLVFKFALF